MKTFIRKIILCVLMLYASSLSAQMSAPHFSSKGSQFISLGIGLFPTFLKDGGDLLIPPTSLFYEKKLKDHLSLGGSIGYSNTLSKVYYGAASEFKAYENRFYYFNVRSGGHCVLYKNWDFYGGGSIGYYFLKMKSQMGAFGDFEHHRGIKEQSGNIVWNAYVGLRYNCCSRLIFHGELSYGVSIFNFGIGFKLGK